jgi:hypothetical protein
MAGRGRKPKDDAKAAAERAQRDQIQADVKAATEGKGWEVPDESDLLVEAQKIAPFLEVASSLATMGDEAGASRKAGWAKRRFDSEEAAQVFTRGLRRALRSLGYSLTTAGPVTMPSGGVRMDFRARKTQVRKTAQESVSA